MSQNVAVLERFAKEYALQPEKPISYWTKRFRRSRKTIERWLKSEVVKRIVQEEKEKIEKDIEEKIREYTFEAIDELAKIMRSKKINEVKRKACNDILGLAKIENVNIEGKAKVDVKIDYTKLSDEELLQRLQAKLGGKDKDT